jgi:Fur family ferric uptake transcriptional regulator
MEKTKEDVMELMMQRMKNRIKDKKYKMTSQRQIILKAFVESNAKHLSAEDVYEIVRKANPDIGLATVYRTLDLFTEMDLLKKLDFDEGCNRYELNDREDDGHFHHHLICLGCGKVWECRDDLLETLETILYKRLHFQTVDHQLKVYGYCEECQEKRKAQQKSE